MILAHRFKVWSLWQGGQNSGKARQLATFYLSQEAEMSTGSEFGSFSPRPNLWGDAANIWGGSFPTSGEAPWKGSPKHTQNC